MKTSRVTLQFHSLSDIVNTEALQDALETKMSAVAAYKMSMNKDILQPHIKAFMDRQNEILETIIGQKDDQNDQYVPMQVMLNNDEYLELLKQEVEVDLYKIHIDELANSEMKPKTFSILKFMFTHSE